MLTATLIVTNILLLAFGIAMGVNVYRIKTGKRLRRAPWAGPIPRVPVDEFDDVFAPDDLGPTPRAEVVFLGKGTIPVPGGTTDFEAWILTVLAKRSRVMFEFGTCTGKTAYLWARNLPPDGKVHTLTLAPTQLALYQHAEGDSAALAEYARQESAFTRFRYSGTDVEHKVVQLYGDSKAFDETPLAGQCDVVFVDGSHAYSYVMSDSAKALRMVKPGGIVLWHDYRGPHAAEDVFRALNELAESVRLVHIEGTALVAHRRPAA